MNQDDLTDLLALGGAVSQQINASNSMRMEYDKAIPRLDPRRLIQDATGGFGQPTPSHYQHNGNSVQMTNAPAIINDVDFKEVRVSPMMGLIPVDEALTDDMRKRGITGADFVNRGTTGTPAHLQAARIAGNIQPVIKEDKDQMQFTFLEKLDNPRKQTQMEYFDEKFLLLDVKLDKMMEKLNILLGKKKKI
jgi:hypothetical protein